MIEHPITLRALSISRIVEVTPSIRRITLVGPELGPLERSGFHCPAFVTGAADDHIKIFPPTAEPLVLPAQGDGYLYWPEDPPAIDRDYTVRRFDLVTGELDIELVRHHDGPGAGWAEVAAIGDVIHVAGPRASHQHPGGEVHRIFIGDETALPAIARFVDESADLDQVTVIVVIDEANAAYPLPSQCTRQIIRTQSDIDPPELLDAVREALDAQPDAYVWAGLEFQTTRDVRAVLRERQVDRKRTSITHYWRRPVTTSVEERAAAEAVLRPLADLLPPTVLRVAVTVGLPDAIFAGANTTDTAAGRTGCDENAVGVLLRYLETMQVVRRHNDDSYELTLAGELLLHDDPSGYHDYLDLHQASGHMASALPGLLQAVQEGGAAYRHVHGRSFWERLSADDELGAGFDRYLAGWAAEWVPDVCVLDVWSHASRVVDVGGGAAALSMALAAANPNLMVTMVELLGPAERARAAVAERNLGDRIDIVDGSFFEPLPTDGDVYVLAQILHDWPDDDATRIVARCSEALSDDGRLLILERLPDPDDPASASDHAAMSVLMLALFGARERSLADYDALLRTVGLVVADVARLPSGICAIEARRDTQS